MYKVFQNYLVDSCYESKGEAIAKAKRLLIGDYMRYRRVHVETKRGHKCFIGFTGDDRNS